MNDVIKHHGITGMKWGIRRYQNKDGSLTPLGKRREAKLDAKMNEYARKYKMTKARKLVKKEASNEEENRQKNIKDMSDVELQAKINRIRNEQTLASLQPQQISRGKKFITSIGKNVIAPAATQAGKNLLSSYLEKVGKELLGLDSKDELSVLRKEVDTLELKKRKKEAVDYLNGKKNNDSDEITRLAKEYENRQKIDRGQKYFNEGKYSPKVMESVILDNAQIDGQLSFNDIRKKKK